MYTSFSFPMVFQVHLYYGFTEKFLTTNVTRELNGGMIIFCVSCKLVCVVELKSTVAAAERIGVTHHYMGS